MATWTLGKKKFELIFDMDSWQTLERKVGTIDTIDEILTGADRIEYALRIGMILAAEGAKLGLGDEPDEKWIRAHIVPKAAAAIFAVINTAMADGFRMEVKDDEENTVVDEVLADIEKKAGPDA